MKQITDDDGCFVCGRDNPHGLKLSFRLENNEARCSLSIPVRFQGWQGIIHGGIVATLLDEVMAKAAHFAGYAAVTVDMAVRYKKPTPADTPLLLSGRVVEQQRRILITEGELCHNDGTVLASGRARFFVS